MRGINLEDGARRPTMYDVAELARVSHQTVSRVVLGNKSVRDSTAQRVRTAIETLGYEPNLDARALAHRRGHAGQSSRPSAGVPEDAP